MMEYPSAFPGSCRFPGLITTFWFAGRVKAYPPGRGALIPNPGIVVLCKKCVKTEVRGKVILNPQKKQLRK